MTEIYPESDRNQSSEIMTSAILAQRILEMIIESGITPKQQKLALDIVRDYVLERLYGPVVANG